MDVDEDVKQSQEILVAFWGVFMLVLIVLFIGAIMTHNRHNRQLNIKLYNFKRAPKNYVD